MSFISFRFLRLPSRGYVAADAGSAMLMLICRAYAFRPRLSIFSFCLRFFFMPIFAPAAAFFDMFRYAFLPPPIILMLSEMMSASGLFLFAMMARFHMIVPLSFLPPHYLFSVIFHLRRGYRENS